MCVLNYEAYGLFCITVITWLWFHIMHMYVCFCLFSQRICLSSQNGLILCWLFFQSQSFLLLKCALWCCMPRVLRAAGEVSRHAFFLISCIWIMMVNLCTEYEWPHPSHSHAAVQAYSKLPSFVANDPHWPINERMHMQIDCKEIWIIWTGCRYCNIHF